MERIVERTYLYDFYGELLTDHQRRIYEMAADQDLSVSEIAEECGISRQGVSDLLKRCDAILSDYEARLHLVERFTKASAEADRIIGLASALPDSPEARAIGKAAEALKDLL